MSCVPLVEFEGGLTRNPGSLVRALSAASHVRLVNTVGEGNDSTLLH